MIALTALLFFGLWGFVSYKISSFIIKKIKLKKYSKIVVATLTILLFFIPISDEIAGGIQFRSLCANDAMAYVNVDKSQNKELLEYSNEMVMDGYILPTKKYEYFFKDIASGEVVVSWRRYSSAGGWLSRGVGFNSSEMPFTFDGSCRPDYSGMSIVKDLNINLQSN